MGRATTRLPLQDVESTEKTENRMLPPPKSETSGDSLSKQSHSFSRIVRRKPALFYRFRPRARRPPAPRQANPPGFYSLSVFVGDAANETMFRFCNNSKGPPDSRFVASVSDSPCRVASSYSVFFPPTSWFSASSGARRGHVRIGFGYFITRSDLRSMVNATTQRKIIPLTSCCVADTGKTIGRLFSRML